MKNLLIILGIVLMSTTSFSQTLKNSKNLANSKKEQIKHSNLSYDKGNCEVKIYNTKISSTVKKELLAICKTDFTTKRFGSGYIIFEADDKGNIYSMTLPLNLYENKKKEFNDKDFIPMMSNDDFFDELKKCGRDSSSAVGAVMCAVAVYAQSIKDCIEATSPQDKATHCSIR